MKFCGGCGSPLSNRCPQCDFDNPPGFRFCGSCGANLAASSSAPASASRREPPPVAQSQPAPVAEEEIQGERRQLTVMFCDLADSTGLASALDPEELQGAIKRFQRLCGQIIDRYGGYVAQFLGDGLLVYFGYPTGHEDDARRAVGAALEIVSAVQSLGSELRPGSLRQEAVRVGIHTGLVVTGEIGAGGRRERLALGQAPNVAARLETLAEPGEILISDRTR